LLEAVTHYAIGGTDALEALGNQSAARPYCSKQITDPYLHRIVKRTYRATGPIISGPAEIGTE
jgi:hypothetical protein